MRKNSAFSACLTFINSNHKCLHLLIIVINPYIR